MNFALKMMKFRIEKDELCTFHEHTADAGAARGLENRNLRLVATFYQKINNFQQKIATFHRKIVIFQPKTVIFQ